jgi:Tfp pilus assembly protein PilE
MMARLPVSSIPTKLRSAKSRKNNMSVSYSTIQPQQTQRGLAITSLVLGIISIPTFGLLVVGAIIAIVLGAVALKRARKEPAIYGGKGMAIAGIITGLVSLLLVAVIGVMTAIAVPKLNENLRRGRETAAINALRTIHNNEATFVAINSRCGTLKELAEARLIEQRYANGTEVAGFVYSSSGVSEKTYCVHAVRTSSSVARRDFVVCEDGIIHSVESKTPGVVKRGEGVALEIPYYSR